MARRGARQHRVAWTRIAQAFPELEIWLVDVEALDYQRTSWMEWLRQCNWLLGGRMTEKCYGGRRLAYAVTERDRSKRGRIQVFVFHENMAMRRDLENSDPSQLLKRYKALLRSSIVAQKWLAEVIRDYWSHFEKDLVDFEFIVFKTREKLP